jgi:hypothetical protein
MNEQPYGTCDSDTHRREYTERNYREDEDGGTPHSGVPSGRGTRIGSQSSFAEFGETPLCIR